MHENYTKRIFGDLLGILKKKKWPSKFNQSMKVKMLDMMLEYYNEEEEYILSKEIKELKDAIDE